MKPKLRIHFCDFWRYFEPESNLFTQVLSNFYDLIPDAKNPDLLFFSLFGSKHNRYNCKKVLVIGENARPDFNICDYSLNFDYSDDPRSFRFPLYTLFGDPELITVQRDPQKILSEKTQFCNFVYSNPGSKLRVNFFKRLSQYKKIDSAGNYLNNVGTPVKDKLEFIKKYKFTIAFENESQPGYTTEKIFDAFRAQSLPIYWGNELVDRDFNSEAFLNYYAFPNEDALIERIIEIDNNDALYLDYISKPPFKGNIPNEFVNPKRVSGILETIAKTPILPVSERLGFSSKNSFEKYLFFAKKDLIYEFRVFRKKIKNFNTDRLIVKLKKLKNRYNHQ
ncbi:MAG: glycosyltransferase family 10 [Candidatus Kapabacteria bacterium]|nr:glycosyltransferase family 10 [Candidatus Kapabacteria bacterium]